MDPVKTENWKTEDNFRTKQGSRGEEDVQKTTTSIYFENIKIK